MDFSKIEQHYDSIINNIAIEISLAFAAGEDERADELLWRRWEAEADRAVALWEAAHER